MEGEDQSPGGHGLVLENGRVKNTLTGTTPPILHFAGAGHWPNWKHPERVGTCAAYEFMRVAGQPELVAIMEEKSHKKFFGLMPWKSLCTPFVTLFDQLAMKVSTAGDFFIWGFARVYGPWLLVVALGMLCLVVRFFFCLSVPVFWKLLLVHIDICGRSPFRGKAVADKN